MEDAEKLFTETFNVAASRFAVVSSFREISRLGLPHATIHIYDQYLEFADELFNDPQNDKLFIDKQKAFDQLGGVENLGAQLAQDNLKKYKASVDAASLIFAHSIIDNAALNYCRVCALLNHNDWEIFIKNKKLSVEEIRDQSIDQILKIKVHEYIDSLDRESLLFKVDRLFQVCRPPLNFSPLHNYAYDRERLKKLDQMRHEIVHESSSVPLLPSGDEDIWYLQKTANFFMALVNYKYEVKINPNLMFKAQEK